MSGLLEWIRLVTDDFYTEWDDGCPSLVETLAREAEWRAQETSNDVVQWGVGSAKNGWEVTPPASPIEEAWPGVLVDEHCGVWPSSAEVVQAHCDTWLGFLSDAGGIKVTVEMCLSIGEVSREHSTCRFP
jgi:hypothetical protein